MGVRGGFAVEGKGNNLSEAFDRHPRALEASFGLLPSPVGWSGTSGHSMHAHSGNSGFGHS